MPTPSGTGEGSEKGLSARLVSPEEIEGRLTPKTPPGRLRRPSIPAAPPVSVPSLPASAPHPLSEKSSSAGPVIPPVSPGPPAPVAQSQRENREKIPAAEKPSRLEAKNPQAERNKTVSVPSPAPAPAPVPAPLQQARATADEKKVKEGQAHSQDQRRTTESVPSIPSSPKPAQRQPSLKEKLFDKGVIGDLAKRDLEKRDRENKGRIPLRDAEREHAYNFGQPLRDRGEKKFDTDKELAFDEKELKFMLYNMKLKDRLEHIWIYPPSAAARGISGDLIIRFTIMKNGRLGAVELVRTSGHKDLDDAAVRALRDGSPYWPLPESWGMDSYTIEGHFIYTIIYNL